MKEFYSNKYMWFCSMKHMRKEMIDPTKYEIDAMTFAGKMAGEYMQEINKTDLKTFTKDEWMTLLKVVYGNTTAKVAELENKNVQD